MISAARWPHQTSNAFTSIQQTTNKNQEWTAGGCRIMLLWKPLQVCGPRNNKPQIFRVCKKKKWGRKGKKTDWNKYHKPKALQALLKGGHNSIVKLDLPGRTLQRTKEFSCKKYPGVCQKKGRRKQN